MRVRIFSLSLLLLPVASLAWLMYGHPLDMPDGPIPETDVEVVSKTRLRHRNFGGPAGQYTYRIVVTRRYWCRKYQVSVSEAVFHRLHKGDGITIVRGAKHGHVDVVGNSR
jgi:hypothetical protein